MSDTSLALNVLAGDHQSFLVLQDSREEFGESWLRSEDPFVVLDALLGLAGKKPRSQSFALDLTFDLWGNLSFKFERSSHNPNWFLVSVYDSGLFKGTVQFVAGKVITTSLDDKKSKFVVNTTQHTVSINADNDRFIDFPNDISVEALTTLDLGVTIYAGENVDDDISFGTQKDLDIATKVKKLLEDHVDLVQRVIATIEQGIGMTLPGKQANNVKEHIIRESSVDVQTLARSVLGGDHQSFLVLQDQQEEEGSAILKTPMSDGPAKITVLCELARLAGYAVEKHSPKSFTYKGPTFELFLRIGDRCHLCVDGKELFGIRKTNVNSATLLDNDLRRYEGVLVDGCNVKTDMVATHAVTVWNPINGRIVWTTDSLTDPPGSSWICEEPGDIVPQASEEQDETLQAIVETFDIAWHVVKRVRADIEAGLGVSLSGSTMSEGYLSESLVDERQLAINAMNGDNQSFMVLQDQQEELGVDLRSMSAIDLLKHVTELAGWLSKHQPEPGRIRFRPTPDSIIRVNGTKFTVFDEPLKWIGSCDDNQATIDGDRLIHFDGALAVVSGQAERINVTTYAQGDGYGIGLWSPEIGRQTLYADDLDNNTYVFSNGPLSDYVEGFEEENEVQRVKILHRVNMTMKYAKEIVTKIRSKIEQGLGINLSTLTVSEGRLLESRADDEEEFAQHAMSGDNEAFQVLQDSRLDKGDDRLTTTDQIARIGVCAAMANWSVGWGSEPNLTLTNPESTFRVDITYEGADYIVTYSDRKSQKNYVGRADITIHKGQLIDVRLPGVLVDRRSSGVVKLGIDSADSAIWFRPNVVPTLQNIEIDSYVIDEEPTEEDVKLATNVRNQVMNMYDVMYDVVSKIERGLDVDLGFAGQQRTEGSQNTVAKRLVEATSANVQQLARAVFDGDHQSFLVLQDLQEEQEGTWEEWETLQPGLQPAELLFALGNLAGYESHSPPESTSESMVNGLDFVYSLTIDEDGTKFSVRGSPLSEVVKYGYAALTNNKLSRFSGRLSDDFSIVEIVGEDGNFTVSSFSETLGRIEWWVTDDLTTRKERAWRVTDSDPLTSEDTNEMRRLMTVAFRHAEQIVKRIKSTIERGLGTSFDSSTTTEGKIFDMTTQRINKEELRRVIRETIRARLAGDDAEHDDTSAEPLNEGTQNGRGALRLTRGQLQQLINEGFSKAVLRRKTEAMHMPTSLDYEEEECPDCMGTGLGMDGFPCLCDDGEESGVRYNPGPVDTMYDLSDEDDDDVMLNRDPVKTHHRL